MVLYFIFNSTNIIYRLLWSFLTSTFMFYKLQTKQYQVSSGTISICRYMFCITPKTRYILVNVLQSLGNGMSLNLITINIARSCYKIMASISRQHNLRNQNCGKCNWGVSNKWAVTVLKWMIQTLTWSPTIAAPPTQSLEYHQQEVDRRAERSIVLDPGHGIPWSCDPSNGGTIGARHTSSLNSGPCLRFQRPNLDLDHVSTFLTRWCGCLQLLTRIGSFGWIQILPELDHLDRSKFYPNWIIWMDPNFTQFYSWGCPQPQSWHGPSGPSRRFTVWSHSWFLRSGTLTVCTISFHENVSFVASLIYYINSPF